jgi:hypothetical protein
MQAIVTRFLPATNTKPTRIKAMCERGSIVVPYNHTGTGDAAHRETARALCNRFCREDEKEYKTPFKENPWNRDFVTGQIPSGDYVHVFAPQAQLVSELKEVCDQYDALLTAHAKPFGWGRLVTENARKLIAKVEGSK